MITLNFPGCCTAQIVSELGQSMVADGGPTNTSKAEINDYLRDREHRAILQGMAVVVVTTNNQQMRANKVLAKRGYSHSKWMSKQQHPETKVRLWHKPLLD